LAALLLLAAPTTRAEIVVPTQPHQTLEFELHCIRDTLTLYMGDPQELLRLECRPAHGEPRVDYTSEEQAILRIRDQQLFHAPPPANLESMSEKQREKYLSDAQTWEARVCPSGPTTFRLQIDDGEGVLDFTDFEVRDVRIKAENTRLDIEFERPNPMQAEAFGTTIKNGSIEFRQMLNARARAMGFVTTGSVCSFQLTGKEYEGETTIVFEGGAEEMNFVLSKEIGLRVEAPAEALKHFESKGLIAEGKALVSKDFAKANCRIRLRISQAAAKMTVDWD
jgi:hypothetical protein